jgi:hypothetical protein
LSYWPALRRKSLQKQAESDLFHSRPFGALPPPQDQCYALLGFPVRGVLPVMTAELLQFQLFRHGLLVLRRRVIPTFALTALKGDDFSACARHDLLLRL